MVLVSVRFVIVDFPDVNMILPDAISPSLGICRSDVGKAGRALLERGEAGLLCGELLFLLLPPIGVDVDMPFAFLANS